jgi:hypothetical protein
VSCAMLLDRVAGDSFPSLASAADVKSFEKLPYLERIAAAACRFRSGTPSSAVSLTPTGSKFRSLLM